MSQSSYINAHENLGELEKVLETTVGPKGPKMCHLDVLSLIILA